LVYREPEFKDLSDLRVIKAAPAFKAIPDYRGRDFRDSRVL